MSKVCKTIYSLSHEIQFNTKVSSKLRGRRCFTEICRKVDGSKKDPKKDSKESNDSATPVMHHPYTVSCFELFIGE
jgi:hypothetical protein